MSDIPKTQQVMSINPPIPARRVLALCEYPVYIGERRSNPGPEEPCEEPAITVWEWPNDGGQMFLCAKHDAMVLEQQKANDEYGDYKDWGTICPVLERRR